MKKMKQRMKAKASKIVASILVAAMAVAIIPKFTGTGTVFAAGSKNGENTCLGTSGIAAPAVPASADSAWSGSYVYFGSYDGYPIKFRVLAPSTTAYGGSTLFLDSDAKLFNRSFDDGSKVWADSELRTYLNGDFYNGSFSDIERGAIASSTVPAHDLEVGTGAGQVASWTQEEYGQYVALNGDKIFVLDAEEASNIDYGYSNSEGACSDRVKVGTSEYWWLRSAFTLSSLNAGGVDDDGILSDYDVDYGSGVAPALNINQSSIIFSSLISGNFNTAGAEYKLTIADDNLTIAVPAGQEVTASGTTITVPYQISGTDAGTATRASVLILNKAYGASDAQIIYYDALGGTFSNSGAATGTFELPSSLDISGWGTNYYVYILAEDINGEKETDYASTPFAIDAPEGAVTTNYNVTVNSGSADVPTAASGATVTIIAGIAPAGKEFDKWVVNSGTITLADATSSTTTFTMPAENVEVTATWKDKVVVYPVQVTITTFDKDGNPLSPQDIGGTATADKTTVVAGDTVIITVNPNSGYELEDISYGDGGTSDSVGTSTSVTVPNDFSTTASNFVIDITFREKATTPTTYSVTFDANGHGTAPAAQTIDDGNAATEPTAPTASGWTFGGWYTEAACANKFDFSTAITSDITLYAKWTEEIVTPITYTVTFETNGGSAVAAQSVVDGGKATKPADPTKEGFVFDGWYQDATLSVAFNFDTPITADITLYAKWTEETPSTVYYTVVSGGNSTFTKGSASDLVVTVKRSEADETCFSHFTGVQIDGVALVSGTDYTAVAGSTVITIKAETLNNLSEGGHTITVLFDDGKTETSVTAKAAGTNNNSDTNGNKAIPATGESLAPTLFVGIAFIAVAGMLFAVILVQKRRKSVQR